MLDEAVREARGGKVPWDDLRAQRVLENIRAQQEKPAPRWHRHALVAAAAVALISGAYTLGLTQGEDGDAGVATLATGSGDEAGLPTAGTGQLGLVSVLALADGSHAELAPGAQVRVAHESADEVRVAHTAGKARYSVRPNHERRFVVLARGVEISAIGTEFTVDVRPHSVSVRVDEGRVLLGDGGDPLELGAGESVELEDHAGP